MDHALLPGHLSQLPPGPFARLAALLEDVSPGGEPINLSVGDPRGKVPAFVSDAIARYTYQFGEYPAINGTADWREAAGEWLRRRFGLPEKAVNIDCNLLPLDGTREGLFLAPFVVTPEAKAGQRPAILIPNPFYQCYAAAALAAGAEPIYVPALPDTNHLPDYASLPQSVLSRTVAAYICSPSNPEGACADEAYWKALFDLAERYDFAVFADECYADIYYDRPPVSALSIRYGQSQDLSRLLTFHSLSKRSGLPGLRSGIVAGDRHLMGKFRGLRNYCGPQVPMPILAASAAAWRDEEHVAANRALYAERLDWAERYLGQRSGFRRPQGGFFLWLDVGHGENAALKLWREAGIRVLPGAYMGREAEAGKIETNPGFRYVRIALVQDLSTIGAALRRLGEILSEPV